MAKKRKKPAKVKKAVKSKKKAKVKADKPSPQKKPSETTKPTPQDFESGDATSSTLKKRALFVTQYMKTGCNISATCLAVHIDRKTYYRWRKSDDEFAQKCIDAEDELIDLAESQLFRNITDGKETSLIFFLCNKGRHRDWQTVSKIEQRVTLKEIGDRFKGFSNKDLKERLDKLSQRLGVQIRQSKAGKKARSKKAKAKKVGVKSGKGRANRKSRSARGAGKAKGKRKVN